MGEQQRQELARLFSEDEEFKAALMSVSSLDEMVRIAREHGIAATAEDFARPEGRPLSDAELEGVAGGVLPFYSCSPEC